MNNEQVLQNLENLDLLFKTLGFDEKTKKDHMGRIMKIIFASASEKLDQATELKDKAEFPEMESLEDFYNYYEQYVDRATISKVIEEETNKAFTEYFATINNQLPK